MTPADKVKPAQAFANIKADYPTLTISAPGDGEAQGFAKELMDCFNEIGMHVDRVGFVISTSAASAPLQVVIKNFKKVPQKAETFARAMNQAGLLVTGGLLDGVADDEFVLVVNTQR